MINIIEMLEKTATEYPDKIAFSDPVKDISFSQLHVKAKQVATYFLNTHNDYDLFNKAVAFYMEKSVDSVIIMFASIYCGAFYSFIDVRQPKERAENIVSVLEPAIIISDENNIDFINKIEVHNFNNNRIILISEILSKSSSISVNEEKLNNIRKLFYDKMPLYVNFTSGSTGIPKGVVVGHSSVIDFIEVFTEVFNINSDDIIANQAPFDFDVSVKDIYSGLYTGARVQLIPRDYFSNPTILMDYLVDREVTTLIWAVSAMCFVSIMNGFEYKTPKTINKIMFSGELMPIKQLNKWRKYIPDAMYVNLYGPTEITCNCTYYIIDREFEKDEVIPIGIPFVNEKVFLLDENDSEITDSDIEGEICVSGSCLALGYFKDKQKTKETFVQNPLNNEYLETIYRTGDLGKYNTDRNLVYTSRKDFQIKHMGQRIELGDIEVSAMSIEDVSRACCLYDYKHKKIILFYTGEIDKEELSEKIHDKLPLFMVPGKTIKIDDFPLNKNGKIDRKALEELY